MIRPHLALLAIAAPLLAGSAPCAAQAFPVRPLRIIVPTGAGGITDILARLIGQRLAESLGQPVVIDNRPGVGGIVGTQIATQAAPDGHTLLMVFPAHPVNPSLVRKLPYDTVRDLAPVTMVSAVALLLTVNASLPVRNVRELIALAQERPGQVNFGAVGRGSLGHLGAELFRARTGTQMTLVPYKGAPQVFAALVGGEIAMYFVATMGSAMPLVQAGRLRLLGVSTRERLPALPDVPPIADTVPGYEVRGWNGLLVPAGTPRAIVDRLNREIVRIIRSREFAERLAGEGAIPVGNTPAEFDAIIRADIAKWAQVVREAGLQPD